VHLVRLSLQSPFHPAASIHLARQLRSLGIDILHSHLFSASLAASPIGSMCGVPVIIETPHIREAWRRGLIKGHYFVDRLIGTLVDDYIAVSKANERYLIEEKGLPANKIHVIHNGCDLQKYRPQQPVSRDLKRSMGFAEDDPVLIVLGRLEPQKGHAVLLEAFSIVVREFPSARLVCVGEGSLRMELQQRTDQLRLEKAVRFVGFQSNVPDWLAISDISVLPSLFEGLPLVAIESLAAERVMVATAVDGTTEVVINEVTGLTVPPGEAQGLAEAVLRLLRQPELRRRMACAGRRWVLEHFSQEQQIRKTEDLYLQAWGRSLSAVKRNTLAEAKKSHRDCDSSVQIEQETIVSERR
jgi:glycosyltransferase involved in cell wall biosynthesis